MISSDLAILIISSILIEGYKIQTDFGSVEVLGPFTFFFEYLNWKIISSRFVLLKLSSVFEKCQDSGK